MGDLLDIVDQRIEKPLHAHLGSAPLCKAVQTFDGGDVGEHRFHDAHAPGVLLATVSAVDLAPHLPQPIATNDPVHDV